MSTRRPIRLTEPDAEARLTGITTIDAAEDVRLYYRQRYALGLGEGLPSPVHVRSTLTLDRFHTIGHALQAAAAENA